jgi:hypothetical protein
VSKRKPCPPLPKKVQSPLGPIKVRRVKNLKSDGEDCHGVFTWHTRSMQINANLEGAAQWATFFHEWVHAVLADGGMDATLPYAVCESVCDLLGTSLTGLLRSGILTPEQKPKIARKEVFTGTL